MAAPTSPNPPQNFKETLDRIAAAFSKEKDQDPLDRLRLARLDDPISQAILERLDEQLAKALAEYTRNPKTFEAVTAFKAGRADHPYSRSTHSTLQLARHQEKGNG